MSKAGSAEQACAVLRAGASDAAGVGLEHEVSATAVSAEIAAAPRTAGMRYIEPPLWIGPGPPSAAPATALTHRGAPSGNRAAQERHSRAATLFQLSYNVKPVLS